MGKYLSVCHYVISINNKILNAILGFVENSLKATNIYDEVKVGTDPFGKGPRDFFVVRKNDDENLIEIDSAIVSDTDQLQSIDFDIIFSKPINRIGGTNYIPVNITNETDTTTVTDEELDDFGLFLDYEVEEAHLINNSVLPDLDDRAGNAGRLYPAMKTKSYKEPSNHLMFLSG